MTTNSSTRAPQASAVEGPDPVVLAEQALLGALLLDPHQTGMVHSWLTAAHFYRSAHQVLYQALVDQYRDTHPALGPAPGDEDALAWLTDATRAASRQTPGITPSYPHTLAAACPRSDHAAVYGRMVVEAALQRTVAEHATRMLASAQAALTAGGEALALLAHLDQLTHILAQLDRVAGSPRGHRPTPAADAADRPPASPRRAGAVEEDLFAEEELLVAGLLQAPRVIGEIAAWLRPEDFADSGLGAVFSLLVHLHRSGSAIDRVTLLWEARRQGLLADRVLTAERILALAPSPGDPDFSGEIVTRRALARTAAGAAQQIRDLAATLPPDRLLPRALALLAPVQQARQRWHLASSPPADRIRAFRARR